MNKNAEFLLNLKSKGITVPYSFNEDGGIHISGSLDLSGDKALKSLPDNLTVDGHLFLSNCVNLAQLPNGLEVDSLLDISNCTAITSLPADLVVGFSLDASYCPNLECLPEGLEVENLDVTGSNKIKELPASLKVALLEFDPQTQFQHCSTFKDIDGDVLYAAAIGNKIICHNDDRSFGGSLEDFFTVTDQSHHSLEKIQLFKAVSALSLILTLIAIWRLI